MNENNNKANLGGGKQVNINLEDTDGVHVINIGGESEDGDWNIDPMLFMAGFLFIMALPMGIMSSIIPVFIPIVLCIGGAVIGAFGIIRTISNRKKIEELNKIASFVVTSGLRRIDDIVRLSGMSEVKVIDNLRILTSASSSLKLGNDARYLKGGKLDLQSMEIKLSDKYIEKEPWTCVYCRAVNEKDALVCSSCHAPKKKV